jgi:hemoglobin
MSEFDPTADAASVDRAVALFLQRMLEDQALGWAFEGINQKRLQRHAVAFVIAALGGPDDYLGRDLREVHERLNLGNDHFDSAVVHLVSSLRDAGISEGVLAELSIRLEPLRALIVVSTTR